MEYCMKKPEHKDRKSFKNWAKPGQLVMTLTKYKKLLSKHKRLVRLGEKSIEPQLYGRTI